jgi:hypothetical protein
MPNGKRTFDPNEIERTTLDEHTILSVYQAGYSLIKVKSVFGNQKSYPDLLYQIIQRKLNHTSVS